MKIFISWAKKHGNLISETLAEWLQHIFIDANIFISSIILKDDDIWKQQLKEELRQSEFGLFCLTKESIYSAWQPYELGEITGQRGSDKVFPILFENDIDEKQTGPFANYRFTKFSKAGFEKLILDLYSKHNELPDINETVRLNKKFNELWPAVKPPFFGPAAMRVFSSN